MLHAASRRGLWAALRSRPDSRLAFLSHFLPGLPGVTKQINTLTQVPVSGCALGETKMVHLGYIS